MGLGLRSFLGFEKGFRVSELRRLVEQEKAIPAVDR